MALVPNIDALRVGIERNSHDVEMQRLYERWLKRDTWKARSEALPLVVGVEPETWDAYLSEHQLADAEQELWQSFAADNGIETDDQAIAVAVIYEWFRSNNVELPSSFTRLYDFVRRTMLRAKATDIVADDAAQSASCELAPEKEIVLGAALSIVATMPDRCRDEYGFVDGGAVSKLIVETAARWFGSAPPSMTQEQMARLIDKWLE